MLGLQPIGRLTEGRRPSGAALHLSDEQGELPQRLCHDDSTINIIRVLL